MLTLYEVAEKLKLHYNTIYKYIRSGELKAIKLNRVYRVEEKELEKFKKRNKFNTSLQGNGKEATKDKETQPEPKLSLF